MFKDFLVSLSVKKKSLMHIISRVKIDNFTIDTKEFSIQFNDDEPVNLQAKFIDGEFSQSSKFVKIDGI